MAPPSKPNGFMGFVNDYRWNNPYLSVPQAVSECGVIWEKMTAQERKPFVDGYKKPQKALSEADKAQFKLNEREEHLKRSTERIVMAAKKSQDLDKIKFLFCAFNYFTKDPDGDAYVPAEFAACEYSFREGIISVFSTLIDPGQLNLGLSRDALDHSVTTHNLPLPPKALGERNLAKLRGQMTSYLTKHQDCRPVIVFTTTEMRPIVQSCFRFLACDNKNDFLANILVFDIEYLFFLLKKEVLDMVGRPNDKINIHITNAFFLKDFFEFTNDIACEFHEENDRTKYCTQSMVMRWAFTFSDYMCGDLGISVEPGRHVPSTVKPNYRIHNTNTWSETTLGCGSSVESFQSLASFQSLRINEVNKSRRHRMDTSAISSRYLTASALEEIEEDSRQGESLNEFSDAFVGSRCSSTCADQKGSSKAGSHRYPALHMQRDSPEEFPDEISSISSRRSAASIPYAGADQRGSSKAKEYHRNKEFLEEISPISSRRSTNHKDSSSKAEQYPRQGGSHLYPELKMQRDSPEEFPDEISSISSHRSSEFISYRVSDPKVSSSKAKEYHRKPLVDTQRRSPKEFPDEISPISSPPSSPYGVTYQKQTENYQTQENRYRQDREYKPEREETVYSRRYLKNLTDENTDFDE